MIIVEGWVRAPVEDMEALRPAAREMARATKTSEPGCLEYAFATDLFEPGLLRIIERWTDEAALAAHFATPHMAAFNQALSGAKISGASIKVYAGEEVRTIMER
jgi:quinol monooxygenase YgiN